MVGGGGVSGSNGCYQGIGEKQYWYCTRGSEWQQWYGTEGRSGSNGMVWGCLGGGVKDSNGRVQGGGVVAILWYQYGG